MNEPCASWREMPRFPERWAMSGGSNKGRTVHRYSHHIGDFAKDTMGLSQGEVGAYRLLMDAAYSTESGVPADEVYGISKAHSKAERANTDKVIAKYFTLKDGRYYQKRIDEEVGSYREKSEKASQSARVRWCERNANASESHSEGSKNAMLAISHKPVTKKNQLHARASRLPPDWNLTSEQIEWALGAQPSWTPEHVLQVGEKFRDYWTAKAGRDAAKLDWDATWRNWVRNEPESRGKPRPADPFAGAV